jgi:hypothetical protein
LAAQIAGLAGHAEQLFEPVVIGLQFRVGDRKILDGHFRRNGGLAIAVLQMAAQVVIGRQDPPGVAVPVRAGAAHPGAGQERA